MVLFLSGMKVVIFMAMVIILSHAIKVILWVRLSCYILPPMFHMEDLLNCPQTKITLLQSLVRISARIRNSGSLFQSLMEQITVNFKIITVILLERALHAISVR